MDLQEVMAQKRFAVVGDTETPGKFAHRIRKEMEEAGYTVYAVGGELASLNEIEGDVDVIDICINPVKALQLLRENRKPFRCIVLQPGTRTPEVLAYLEQEKLPYLESCLLVGLNTYGGRK